MRGFAPWRGALLGFSLFLIAAPGQAPEVGSITGRVTLSHVRGAALPSNAYQPRSVSRYEATPSPEIRNVVVYLTGITYRGALAPSHQQIVQEKETFIPRVLAITRGSTVEFPNNDPFFHNVFSLSSASTFNLGRYPKGQTRSREFTKTGLVKVYCQIHSHMSASIRVFDHPYFAIPNADGTFTLPNVPAGTYKLVGWHERVGEHESTVQVQAGRAAAVDVSLPGEDSQ